MTDEEIQAYIQQGGAVASPSPSRESEVARQNQLEKTRGALAGALSPLPIEAMSSLPMTGGIVGGIMGASKLAPFLGNIPAIGRFLPSLVGSTAGTIAGTLGEQGLGSAFQGKPFLSSETGQKVLENTIQNAIFDVGGNLVFSAGGKLFNASKNALEQAGIKKGSLDTPDQAARKAAQEWLTAGNVEGASLTRGQLLGDRTTQTIEGALKYAPGSAGVFDKQQAAVAKRLGEGVEDVFKTLDTSDEFKSVLKGIQGGSGEATVPMLIGDRFAAAQKVAVRNMKDKFSPVYQQMDSQGDGLLVSLKGLKESAQQERAAILKSTGQNPSSAAQDKLDVIDQILGQPDSIPMSAAHGLRSDLLASSRDLTKEGVPSTTKEAYYKKYAQGLRNNMDSVAVVTFGNEEQKAKARELGLIGGVDSPAGLRSGQWLSYNIDDLSKLNLPTTKATTGNNELLRNYWNAQKGYGDAISGLYAGTVTAALKNAPETVGGYLFNASTPSRLRDVNKALVEMQKYAPDKAKGLMPELQHGFLSDMFSSPEGIAAFSKNMGDSNFKQSFNYLFPQGQTRKALEDIANAAKYGLEKTEGGTVMRTGAIKAGIGAAELGAGGLMYFALPEEMRDKIDPSQLALSGTAFILTPRLIANAVTKPATMNALAGLAKAQKNPALYGGLMAKSLDILNKSGVINSDYLNEVNTLVHGKQAPTPETAPMTDADINKYMQGLQQ